jgi:hypothetical protein
MAVNGPQVDRPARPAARAEDVKPRRSGDECRPDCWRPQHVAAGRQTSIPATSSASRRAALSAFNLGAPALMSSPRVLTPIASVSGGRLSKSIRSTPSGGRPDLVPQPYGARGRGRLYSFHRPYDCAEGEGE